MTYSATATIHALILAGTSAHALLDLDCVGIFALTSTGAIAASTFLDWNELLRESVARPVFKVWGYLMVIGTICSMVAIGRNYAAEPICVSNAGEILTGMAQLSSEYNCTYAAFGKRQALRNPGAILAVPKTPVYARRFDTTLLTAMVMAGIFSCTASLWTLTFIHKFQTGQELREIINSHRHDIVSPSLAYSKYGRTARRVRQEAQKKLRQGQHSHGRNICSFILPAAFLTIMVLNEVFILASPTLPYDEQAFAIGQWGPWVGVVLSLVASAITQWNQPYWERRQNIIRAERRINQPTKKPENKPKEGGTHAVGGTGTSSNDLKTEATNMQIEMASGHTEPSAAAV